MKLKKALQKALQFAPKKSSSDEERDVDWVIVMPHTYAPIPPMLSGKKVPAVYGGVGAWDGLTGTWNPLDLGDPTAVFAALRVDGLRKVVPALAVTAEIVNASGKSVLFQSEEAKVTVEAVPGSQVGFPLAGNLLPGSSSWCLKDIRLTEIDVPWAAALVETSSDDQEERADLCCVHLTANMAASTDETRTCIVLGDATAALSQFPEGILIPRKLFHGWPTKAGAKVYLGFDPENRWVFLFVDGQMRFAKLQTGAGFYKLSTLIPELPYAVEVSKDRLQTAARFVLQTAPNDVCELLWNRTTKMLHVSGLGNGVVAPLDQIPIDLVDGSTSTETVRVLMRGRLLFNLLRAWRVAGAVRLRYGSPHQQVVLETPGSNLFRGALCPLVLDQEVPRAAA